MQLNKITTKQISKTKYKFLLPLGATEQHGPSLPFGTDTYIVESICNIVEKKIKDLVVLPVQPYTCSKEHKDFVGTVCDQRNTPDS